ncbi:MULTISPECIES: YopX family protein [unclassified Enterococcus]|uniref:YopX family protein n=1 Tax=unclassified Enterococcus TaxID=2608891 RepID=UPI000A347BEF|nr:MULTISPECIES: YopX family protein [unclassified Enterococcus]OTO71297.1 hypothetical protein A5865_002993 [Enterococcus sp. 12E11_DIV0728]OUZ15327.1 hypothetical protein A5868_000235 [Enterococcus sp. 12F9_DIV0723]
MIPKFRAWDENDNVMRSWMELILTKEKGEDFYAIGYEENKVITSFDHEQVLMQSTGLKDKNGVEIFEGDVVLENGMQRTVSFGEQEYEEDFGNLAYYVGFNVYTKWGYSSIDPVEYEILGNIYENPELLEVEN